MPHLQVTGGPYERHQLLRALGPLDRRRRQLHVQQPCRTLLVPGRPRPRDRDQARSRPVSVRPLGRAHALCNRFARLPPVGRGAEDRTEGNVGRDRHVPDIELAAEGCLVPARELYAELLDVAANLVGVRLVVPVLRGVETHLTYRLFALEIRLQSLHELIHGQLPVVEDELLDRRQGVDRRGEPEGVDEAEVQGPVDRTVVHVPARVHT